jgi:two-component system response regulator NreC
MSIRIILVDDHRIVREGISGILRASPGFEVVAEAGDGKSAIDLTKELLPDVVIIDTTFVRDMLDSGASGYLLKDCASDELVRAVLIVSNNQIYVSPQIANTIIKDYRDRNGHHPEHQEKLSARELTVLRLISEGKSTKEAASKLNVSPKTVETLRLRIMKKIGVHNNSELIKYAIRIGLTSLND